MKIVGLNCDMQISSEKKWWLVRDGQDWHDVVSTSCKGMMSVGVWLHLHVTVGTERVVRYGWVSEESEICPTWNNLGTHSMAWLPRLWKL